MLIGIKPGDKLSGSAGANRALASLEIDAEGAVATIGDRRVSIGPRTLVLWHQSDAGTWHGVKDPAVLAAVKPDVCPDMPHERAVIAVSSSGAGDLAAMVMEIDRPVAIVTSGYKGRRGWWTLILAPSRDGGIETVFSGPPIEWRAKHAPLASL
jgi:hypothetical protein